MLKYKVLFLLIFFSPLSFKVYGNSYSVSEITSRAEKGDNLSQFDLGYLYFNGWGVNQDFSKSFYWFQKSAEQGNIEAQKSLYRMSWLGKGVRQSYQQGVFWLQKAAEGKDVESQRKLGDLYLSDWVGKNDSVYKDHEKAIYWLKLASKTGDGKSLLSLGNFYLSGNDGTKNKEVAMDYYRRSCNSGEELGCIMYNNLNKK